jgi:hypothetical protein
MFEIEKNTLKPLDSIIDKEGTIQIRENHIDKLDIDFSGEAQKCNRLFEQKILTVKNLLNAFWETLSEKEYSKDWKKQDSEDNDIENRFRKWEACCDETQIIQWSKKFSPGIRCDINKYWISWQLVRVLLIYGIEWAYKRNLSGQTFENFNIENDVYDIEYVLCMHHSDALLSNDKKLVIPLTKVLYPEKAIYSNLEECL